ncbi:L-seryl-tRNA(Sec) selenium transferase [Listeria innocua]|uniref:L-seryl-tRNA(Sec) selenium transferase n=1 Tax=Listeria innocua TaxID=1642 RepID=UPI0028935597|nr:L-seryl-tRNA(Sec) selenium transferase [Listeria innocua]
MQSLLAKIPAVDQILKTKPLDKLLATHSSSLVKKIVQTETSTLRQAILAGTCQSISQEALITTICEKIQKQSAYSLKAVINATGTVLHTNLGRANLSQHIANEVFAIAQHASTLEYNLETGQRGSRYEHVEALLCQLTNAEAALVVNNNAAAVLLALSTIGQGKEFVISRGELVEIGGSFRIPDIIELSGGKLKEVGTTNKTHAADYEKGISEQTGAILKVHTSNYKVVGFTETVDYKTLAKIAQKYDLPLVNDLGSGLLFNMEKYGFPPEPTVQEIIPYCDVVTFSGDKLLGGPQAGIIVGKKEAIQAMKKHPLTRALRVDKMTIMALVATLKCYLEEATVLEKIPTLQMLTCSKETLHQKAEYLLQELASLSLPMEFTKAEEPAKVGGGAYPEVELPSVQICMRSKVLSTSELEKRLRIAEIPIIVRIKKDAIYLDMRTIEDEELALITEQFRKLYKC